MIQLALSGLLVQMLADNNHLPGWPNAVSPDRIHLDDPDRDLNGACARWFQTAERRRMGRGSRYCGPATTSDAEEIINYVGGVVGALTCGGVDAEARREGQAYARALSNAVRYLDGQDGLAVVARMLFGGTVFTVQVKS